MADNEGFEDFRNIKTDRENTPEIKCPVCHKQGVVKTERDDENRTDRYSYKILHPNGSKCTVSKGENRDILHSSTWTVYRNRKR